jgi:hypothetical protein
MSPIQQTESESGPKIQRGRVDSITIYEITESELASLEAGTPTGYLFDLFLCLLTVGIAFFVTISTTTISSDRLFSFYAILAIASTIGSLVCLCLWLRYRKSLKTVIEGIKKRVQPPPSSTTPDQTAKT